MFSLIVAVDSNYGIAKNGTIPWNCPADLSHFRNMTVGHVVIMGRKTWDSIPDNHMPLSSRTNVVISSAGNLRIGRTAKYPDLVFGNIEQCVDHFNTNENLKKYKNNKLYVMGGESIYKQFFELNLISDVHITHINANYDCDQFLYMPELYAIQQKSLCDNAIYVSYCVPNHEENQFIYTMQEILTSGIERSDRTGTGTLSIFSKELRFNLSNGQIPMMTTRPVSLRYVFEELMWILRGQTDNKILNKKKIYIWNENTTREFLDNKGLDNLPVGDIGPSYGFQMRHFGANYLNCKKNYNQKGTDQLANVIHLIKNKPTSRRIIMSLWNPSQLDQMALPPCLYGYQFYVANGYLSCKLIQRSSDICLAGSHNCTAGALLVRMLCVITGLKPGELIWSPADIHIYLNQIDSVREQILRFPMPFPTLKIIGRPKHNDILNFEYKHLKLLNYKPHNKITFAMNA